MFTDVMTRDAHWQHHPEFLSLAWGDFRSSGGLDFIACYCALVLLFSQSQNTTTSFVSRKFRRELDAWATRISDERSALKWLILHYPLQLHTV